MGCLRARSVYRYTVLICLSKKLRCNYYRINAQTLSIYLAKYILLIVYTE